MKTTFYFSHYCNEKLKNIPKEKYFKPFTNQQTISAHKELNYLFTA